MSVPAVFRGIDRAAFAAALVSRLRRAGMSVGFTGTEDLVRALGAWWPDDRDQLYWLVRLSVVKRESELVIFDHVFQAVFADAVLELDPNARRQPIGRVSGAEDDRLMPAANADAAPQRGSGLPWATRPRELLSDGDEQDTDTKIVDLPLLVPNRLRPLAETPFERLRPADIEVLCRWIDQTAPGWPTRPTRRTVRSRSAGRIDLRLTLARGRRTGWEPIELITGKPRRKPRRVIAVCDVSESMRQHSVAYLHLLRALSGRVEAETFALGTRLTRLTPVLAHRSPETAIEQAEKAVDDRFGGTRIATSLDQLLRSHHGSQLYGAMVLIGSDGWDSDPPERLAAVMARLSRRAHRVVWMNPRAAADGFEPLTTGMAAALPYIDDLVPADTLNSLLGVFRRMISSRA